MRLAQIWTRKLHTYKNRLKKLTSCDANAAQRYGERERGREHLIDIVDGRS
jgi:hypothetical protein